MRSFIILLAALHMGACATKSDYSEGADAYRSAPECVYGYRQSRCLTAYEAQFYHPAERFDYQRARGPQGYAPYYVYRNGIPPRQYSGHGFREGDIGRDLHLNYPGAGPNTSDGSPEGLEGDLTLRYRPPRPRPPKGPEGLNPDTLYLKGYGPEERRRMAPDRNDRPSAGSRERARERRCPYHPSSSAARRAC